LEILLRNVGQKHLSGTESHQVITFLKTKRNPEIGKTIELEKLLMPIAVGIKSNCYTNTDAIDNPKSKTKIKIN